VGKSIEVSLVQKYERILEGAVTVQISRGFSSSFASDSCSFLFAAQLNGIRKKIWEKKSGKTRIIGTCEIKKRKKITSKRKNLNYE